MDLAETRAAIDTLNRHVSVRQFLDKPVSDEMLSTVLNAARRSPTSSNMQTYSMVVVRDPETRKQLAVLAGNQKHIEACSAFVAFCADVSRLQAAAEMHGQRFVRGLESTLVSTVDAALVGQSVQTAAESLGLGAVMIGGMRNNPKKAGELLGLPDGVYIVYGMSIGWPDWDRVPPQKPRMPESLIIHHERYDTSDPTELIQQYDRDLADYYENVRGSNQHEAAWSGPIANRLNKHPRPHLRGELEEMGFTFE